MKLAITSVVFATAIAFAQDYVSMPPAVEVSSPAAEVSPTIEAQVSPGMEMPTALPTIPMGGDRTASLLARLASYFDLTHVSSDIASMPVVMSKVYDPATGKFVMLSAGVMQSGGAYYVPVCTVNAITSAGMSPVAAVQPDACSYGIQLTPVPSNAAVALYRVIRTRFKAIMSASRPSFMGFGGSSFKGAMQTQPTAEMAMPTQPSAPQM
ncbi:hypothetical protein COEREDRAFT_7089 [Coemansia reversa NRRL 1564]|uniref:Uncharacterized protein n=1 Tax=Coemansia reversa (strain ATCC 12441 / NRRL 1564) TaxID=763665 RepID=A0A2G5BFW4_COERN|nr:hypothetical protein COEREDRAFT_7089 [Coemansia reversa NRRL 1564]|eukprot:PIA17904.1 hypothetical protein COEREDRAFT_7089 [Coemansia reversa NRRL 1564]